jgi:molybdate transport system ATP-binding protein
MSDHQIEARFQLDYKQKGQTGFSLDVDLSLPAKGITAIFGHSGSGKTTLLRCIAGLQSVSKGYLRIHGEIWQQGNQSLAPHQRAMGYVFQEASLLPHLTAGDNLRYAIKRAFAPPSTPFYEECLTLMGIQSLLDRYPSQLSGGERQRVAIARSLLIQPKILLMDEPLAALDQDRKQEILPYLERLRTEFNLPILYVTHSLDEVARLAHFLVVLKNGKVVAQGKLSDVLSRVDLPLKLGEDTGVVIEGHVIEQDTQWHLAKIAFEGGELWVRDQGDGIGMLLRTRILARDVSLSLQAYEDTSILNRLQAEVTAISPDKDEARSLVQLKVGKTFLMARVTRRSVHHLGINVGSQVWAQIKSVAIVR